MSVDAAFTESASWDESLTEQMRWLRENDPVHWSKRDGLWVISKYEDVAAISKNQEVFTSAQGVRPGNPVKIGLIDEAEPRHTQLRRLINRGFTPRMVGRLEQVFRKLVTEHVDAIADQGECDFVEAISVPLPLLMIAEMIGIRREDRSRFHRWSDDMIAADGNQGSPEIMAKAGQAFVEYSAYTNEIIESRRRDPQDDLVSILVGAKDDGVLTDFDLDLPSSALSEEHRGLANNELQLMLVILLVAGNETTRNGISGGMAQLIENPDERQKLIDDPTLIPSAVEEMVRIVSPVHSFSRTVTRDTELQGKQLKAGQQVLMLYSSANRDADVFDDPDSFRVERNPQHLGFGIGTHFCLGANLARMEMRAVFEELLRRIPDARYATNGPVYLPSALVHTCSEMKIRYTPEMRATG